MDRDRRLKRKPLGERKNFHGLSIIPSLFTIGNIFCGYYAIISTLKENYDQAAIAIGIGAVLDGLDGRIARLTKTVSDFGVELDSLADVLTFGVAPAMLAYGWGLTATAGFGAEIAKHVYQLGWLATFAFVICGALRLARFNMHARKPVEGSSKRYFVGLPIPAAACLVAAWVHFWKTPVLQVGSAMLWSFLMLLLAFLMISTVRYYSFKELDLKQPRSRLVFFGVGMLIGLTLFYSEWVLLSLAVIYVSSGPVARIAQAVKRLHPTSSGVPPREPAKHGL